MKHNTQIKESKQVEMAYQLIERVLEQYKNFNEFRELYPIERRHDLLEELSALKAVIKIIEDKTSE